MSFHQLSITETAGKLNTDIQKGLSSTEASKRLAKYGKNELTARKKTSLLRKFAGQFNDFMIIVLLCAAAVSFFASLSEGKPDYAEPVIILLIVILNAVLGLVQEERAQKAIDALKKLSSPNASVIRDGILMSIPSSQLVPGDIMKLEEGHTVSADARVVFSSALSVDESSLTGESTFVTKTTAPLPENRQTSDMKNMVFSSTMVTGGHGIAIVTATGMNALVGKIANMIDTAEAVKTPLQKKLAMTGKTLGICSVIICAALFITGLLKGLPVFSMFMTSVGLAVAAIPEGLPAVVTIMLSLGVMRLAAKNAVIRKLPAVEALGSATYICSDKTGTLTKNEMTVTEVYVPSRGVLIPYNIKLADREEYIRLMFSFALCSNADIHADGTVTASPTEKALVRAALYDKTGLLSALATNRRVAELPFSHEKKRMTTVHSTSDVSFMLTKGAFDYILPLCTHILVNGHVVPITSTHINELKKHNLRMADSALRVIACAARKLPSSPHLPFKDTEEHSLVFLGLAGIEDPPRGEAANAVARCIKAGISPVMITGDHLNTATAIAKKIGILNKDYSAITGNELDKLSDEELKKCIRKYRVFARVTPEHKIRVVRTLQSLGEVTAMTGDGVNDAPALKAADIGCAMGITGTDVAKNASDIILMDDNFATIVNAVKEGRGIYDNIKKAVHFLLSSNIGEIITIFTAILFGMPSPLAPVQLLWINLVTDSLPAVAIGMEPPEPDIMSRAPLPVNKSIFSDGAGFKMFLEGSLIGILSLTAYIYGGSTMAFAVLGISQLFHAFNLKSRHSIFSPHILKNKTMLLSFAICFVLQAAVITISPLATLLELTPLTMSQWIVVILLSLIPVPVVELQKKFNSYKI